MRTVRPPYPRKRSFARAALLAASIFTAGACKRDEDGVARLVEILSGSVEKAEGGEGWSGTSEGAIFTVGDAVRTSADGGARIALKKGGGLKLAPSTVIRFGRGTLDLKGEVEAEDGASLDLVFGTAEISEGGRIKLMRDEEGTYRFDVLVGSATITREDGERIDLGEGEGFGFDVEIGDIDIEPPDPPDAAPLPDAPVADAGPPPGSTVLAVLRGRGARLREGPEARWRRIRPGEHELSEGTEVKLRRRNRLELERGAERATVTGAAEIVVGSPGGPLLDARRGRALIHATEAHVTVQVRGGTIVARRGKGAGSRAEVEVNRRRAKVRARAGRVDVTGKRGTVETLQIGEAAELESSGSITIRDRPPSTAHLAIPAGQSAFIHDPAAPTHVRIRFQGKCDDGVVEMSRGSFDGSSRIFKGEGGSAIIRLPTGRHRYRVRCLAEGVLKRPVAGGRLRLNRASGTKRLPPRPVENFVDADGRTYTVLYQNLLPHITFRWPSAAEGGDYKLHVVPNGGRAKVVDSEKNKVRLSSGTLDEDVYEYWFVDRKGRRSKKSRLRIGFNNAADTGYLRSPRIRDSWGSSITVQGAAIKGWSVTIGETRLPLDSQYRFKTTYSVQNGKKAIAVRFAHPRRGNHYYVRRNGGR